jgi:broad specificity phosphatase PhoE
MDSAAKYKLIEKIVQLEDDALLEEVNALPESRRPDYQLHESHKHLLEGRLAEDDAQPGAGEDWRAVLGRIRKDL